MLRRSIVLVLAIAVVSCSASTGEARSATVVLFDVSNSTRDEDVRARYEDTFALVLAHLRETGGVLGADVIDSNPLVHGELPVNESFEACTIADNSLDCRQGLDDQERRARDEANAILEHESRGTDVFGALALAEQFFEAYPGVGDRTLVVLSDMVQSANRMHLGAIEAWPPSRISELLEEAPEIDLTGVRVYVVGAGATALAGTTPTQIEGIERFWTAWFEGMGASIDFYGANLARFPIPGVDA